MNSTEKKQEPDRRTEAELLAQGWERRFIYDEPRLSEAVEIYRELGFEVTLLPVSPDDVDCSECMKEEPERREKVNRISREMMHEFRRMGFDTGESETPIVPVIIGTLEGTFMFWRRLFDEGIFTNPVVAPAVPESSSRIRTSYMATHTREHLDRALEAFRKVGREMWLIP